MWWIALLPDPSAEPGPALAWWALGYTPRVTRLQDAVVLEVQASLRLFGGAPALLRRLMAEAGALGVQRMGVAPTALAALALARSLPPGERRLRRCHAARLSATLDALPLQVLPEVARHAELLQRLGCQTLGQVRALPRAGLARRFGADLSNALDRAHGQRPEVFDWQVLPEQFEQHLACPSLVEQAAGLMWGAHRLLQALAVWLAARHSGVTGVRLAWQHDPRRGCAPGAELVVHTAQPTREVAHLERLLAEHLARVTLAAPVQALSLQALGVQRWGPDSASLLPQDLAGGEPLPICLERLSARLGPGRVLAGHLQADHRPHHMQHWQPAIEALAPSAGVHPATATAWQPPWLLPEPEPLRLVGERPQYRGPLTLLAGPERLEAGWWDGSGSADPDLTLRDYFIARSAQAGLLWVFRVRPLNAQRGSPIRWFLHGVFG